MKQKCHPWIYLVTLHILISTAPSVPQVASKRKVGPQPDGIVLVPSNQLLRPSGFQVQPPGRPVDLILTRFFDFTKGRIITLDY